MIKRIGNDVILEPDVCGVRWAIDLTKISACCGAEIIYDHICRNCKGMTYPMSLSSDVDLDLDIFHGG